MKIVVLFMFLYVFTSFSSYLLAHLQRSSALLSGGKPLFYLTGFVDGMVDVRRGSAPPVSGIAVSPGAPGDETLVVEVKHRMGRIKA